MKNEICYILVGKRVNRFWFGRLVKKVIGNAISVKFDWEWVLKREEMKGDVLGFWHSHQTDIRPSARDIKTMLAWIRCFGKMLVCVIQTENYRASYLCTFYKSNTQRIRTLEINKHLTDEEYKKFKRKWNKGYTGRVKAKRITILSYEKEPCVWKFFKKLFKFGNFFFGVAE